MMLASLILIPFFGGLAAWLAGRRNPSAARWISLTTLAGALVTVLAWHGSVDTPTAGRWLAESQWRWIDYFGISVHLAIDGLSYLLVLLTYVLGLVSVAVSWKSITERAGFFHFNLLWILSGTAGVFLSLDLFLFFFFWELMIVPMYFVIAIWGHANRAYAAIKFFIFTQASGLLMLAAILGLSLAHHAATGERTFDYPLLLGTVHSPDTARWLMLGFFVAFAVKLPAFPFHPWLADAHTEAPTAGSVILAGLLLKTGAYGLIRFVVPLFPEAAAEFAPTALLLGVIGILYGAVLAFAQTDLKRLIAYTSVSHMGFVLLGVFAGNAWAMEGVIMQLIAHGFSTGALFIVAGCLQDRLHTRKLDEMGGFWTTAPRMGAFALFFALASLGLPGMANFAAEFPILLGTFHANPLLATLGALGIVAATVYSLWIMQRVFHGRAGNASKPVDLDHRETAVLAALAAAILFLGLAPGPVFDTGRPALRADAFFERRAAAISPSVTVQPAPERVRP